MHVLTVLLGHAGLAAELQEEVTLVGREDADVILLHLNETIVGELLLDHTQRETHRVLLRGLESTLGASHNLLQHTAFLHKADCVCC